MKKQYMTDPIYTMRINLGDLDFTLGNSLAALINECYKQTEAPLEEIVDIIGAICGDTIAGFRREIEHGEPAWDDMPQTLSKIETNKLVGQILQEIQNWHEKISPTFVLSPCTTRRALIQRLREWTENRYRTDADKNLYNLFQNYKKFSNCEDIFCETIMLYTDLRLMQIHKQK